MKLQSIERRTGLTRDEFQQHYLKNKIPVIFTDLSANWEATNKWTFDWLQQNHGHIEVPLFGADMHAAGKGYMTPKEHMKFGDYLNLIQNEPTDLRMFLFNIFKHVPEMVNEHYDIDCSNVFITQFQKPRKEILLFSQEQSSLLYQHPFTVQSHVDTTLIQATFHRTKSSRCG